ncbi:hypothetical protein [Streptomyces prasinus]|uniref:hypothetical protein n=1 Tax=Streptomyces prasinus TaxID=67345 RepID=UPI0036877940
MPATDGIVLLLDGQPVPKLPQADTDTSSRARGLSSHTRVDVNTLLDGIKVGCSSFRGQAELRMCRFDPTAGRGDPAGIPQVTLGSA